MKLSIQYKDVAAYMQNTNPPLLLAFGYVIFQLYIYALMFVKADSPLYANYNKLITTKYSFLY